MTKQCALSDEPLHGPLLGQANSAILELALDAYVEVDAEGRICEWNTAAENTFGWKRTEAIGQDCRMLIPARLQDACQAASLAELPPRPRFETTAARRDGSEFPVQVSLSRIESLGPSHVAAFVRDLTESMLARAHALELEARVENILDHIQDSYFEVDMRGKFQLLNSAGVQKQTGYGSDELLGRSFKMSNTPEESLRIQEAFGKVLATGIPNECFPCTSVGKEGTIRHQELSITLRKDMSGKVIGFACISRDCTERKFREAELARAKEAAELANRAKGEFLANMSHEIRTPMNAVVGLTSLLLDMPLEAEVCDYVETIRTSADSLLTIINDILDFSKIESGKLELENRPFDLTRCVEDSADLLRTRAAKKGLELMIEIGGEVPAWVFGDVTRLRQILVNLVSNAEKFTAAGEIVVTVHSENDAEGSSVLHFAVRDTGIGIPPEGMERLFRSFSQVDASTTRKHGGTGLGLAISKRLTELMGGRIWAESEPGKGSTFQFVIPERAASAQQSLVLDRANWAGKKVLIVDDNETNLRILDQQLRKWMLAPVKASTPAAALQLLQTDRFSLALLDFNMPEMDGLQLARAISRLNLTPKMPMAILSSSGSSLKELLQDGGSNPLDAFLTKPVKSHLLAEVVSRLLAHSAAPAHRPANEIDHGLAQRHPLRILLAEDNVVNQKVAVRLLQRMGYQPDVAANGLEVLDAIEKRDYDLVLLDVQMPEMNGLEVAQTITGSAWVGKRPHLIALTANVMQEDRAECLAAGMADFLSKPLDIAQLQRALLRLSPAIPV